MHIVLVTIHVKPDSVDAFAAAVLENARESIREAGVVRFDVLQQAEDPTWFTLYELYRSPEDQLKHRETQHYNRWKDTVANMMADPRQGIRYLNLFPGDANF